MSTQNVLTLNILNEKCKFTSSPHQLCIFKYNIFTFWWSKISVVSKQNDQNIGGVSN